MQKMKLNLQFFASGTITGSSTCSVGNIRIVWSSTKDETNNKSSVTASVQVKKDSGYMYGTFSGTITINGSSKSISKYRSSDDPWNTSWKEVGSYTVPVTHNENGSKSCSISAKLTQTGTSMAGTYTASGTATLDTINRASKLNAIDDFKLTDTITINITKYITAATDKLQIKLGDTLIKEIDNISNGYELTFTTTEQTAIKDLMTSPQATLIFLLTTINGETTLGTSTQSATITSLDKHIFRNVIKKENGHYQVAINGVVDTTKSDVLQVYDDNGNLINDNQVLWDPGEGKGYYMTAGHTTTLSQKISEQKNGIVLVWQGYNNSAVQTYDFNFTFIPKWQMISNSSRGVSCFLVNSTGTVLGTKYVYVYDNKIIGNDANGNGSTSRASGITTTNNKWVLTKVLGV